MQVDVELLQDLATAGYVYIVSDTRSDLRLVNYHRRVAYERRWDEHPILLDCRGMVFAPDGTVVAKPFRKFFNLGERPGTSVLDLAKLGNPEVSVKFDGCFNRNTRLTCWDGSTIDIGSVVGKKLTPTLMGMDEQGNIVPTHVIGHSASKRKPYWLRVEIDRPLRLDNRGAAHPTALWVTPNHHIWINGVCGPIGDAKVGDSLTGHERRPTPSVLHAIESAMLGDGCICRNGTNCNFVEGHKAEHLEYVQEIERWMGDFVQGSAPHTSGYGTAMVRMTSLTTPLLNDYRSRWYVNGKKQLPDDITWMDDFSVAKWYMDDGSLMHQDVQQDRAAFSTNTYTQEDVLRLADRLSEMYGVNCTVYRSKGWCLRVNAGRDGQIDRLWEAIAPHVVPCMRYKLPQRYRDMPYTPYSSGECTIEPVTARITGITGHPASAVGSRSTGFDIQTSTGNYFAGGVLVHNSMITAWWDTSAPLKVRFATRGRFDSDIIRTVEQIWSDQYKHLVLDQDVTYIFEYTGPDNRIVVKYNTSGLTLIGLVYPGYNGEAGEYSYSYVAQVGKHLGIPYARPLWLGNAWKTLHKTEREDFEGYVLYWPEAGVRVKVKLASYVALHRLITGLNDHVVWSALRTGTHDAMRAQLPEEMYEWWDHQARGFFNRYMNDVQSAKEIVGYIGPVDWSDLAQRKRAAAYVTEHATKQLHAACILLLKGQDPREYIFDLFEPKGPYPSNPFYVRDES